MRLLMENINEWSSGLAIWLIDASVKIAIVSIMLLVMCRVLKRASSRLRYGVCVLALAGMICVPFISLIAPNISYDIAWLTETPEEVVIIDHTENIAGWSASVPGYGADSEPIAATTTDKANATSDVASEDSAGFVLQTQWLLGGWLLGVVAIGCYFLLGLMRVQWFACRDCQPADSRWHDALSTITGELHLRFVPKLICSPRTGSPLTWGFVRPIVLLPVQALLWTEDRIRLTLIHESLHIKRGDWVVQLLGCFICAIQWFNPLVWIAYRRLSIEREQSCDEQVVAQGILPSHYASHLLETARQLASQRWLPQMTLAMAHHCRLEDRILALRQHANSARRGVILAGTAIAIMSSLLLTLIGVRLTDKSLTPLPQISEVSDTTVDTDYYSIESENSWEYEKTDNGYRIPKNIKFMMATVTMDAGMQNAFSNSFEPRSIGDINLSWTKDDSIIWFISKGEVRFNNDANAIESLATDSTVEIIEDNDGIIRKVLITSGANNKPNYYYQVQGQTQQFDSATKAWMSELLRDAAVRSKSLTQ